MIYKLINIKKCDLCLRSFVLERKYDFEVYHLMYSMIFFSYYNYNLSFDIFKYMQGVRNYLQTQKDCFFMFLTSMKTSICLIVDYSFKYKEQNSNFTFKSYCRLGNVFISSLFSYEYNLNRFVIC